MRLDDISNICIGFHYSSQILSIGDSIISNQHTGMSYDLVWNIYKSVADKLGLDLPKQYGYAYPYKKLIQSSLQCYKVVSTKKDVLKCDLNYSIPMTMGMLRELTNRSLELDERIKVRNDLIRSRAEKYFNSTNDVVSELISSNWIIKQLL